jgi:UDP-galactopyranose mutase
MMIGPVVKIDPASLPRASNIAYLGSRTYRDLPAYLSGWDAAIMPFARNDATRFISPTKTLEYLAAGKPVVSTAIRDVVHPYGERGLVHVADLHGFPAALDAALGCDREAHLRACDGVLETTSWDKTFRAMSARMSDALASPRSNRSVMVGGEPCSTL